MPDVRDDDLVSAAITVRGPDSICPPDEGTASVLILDNLPDQEFHATGWRATFAIPATERGHGGYLTTACEGYTTRTARIITPLPGENLGIRVANAASEKETTVDAAYAVMDQEFILQFEAVEPVPVDLLPLHVDGQWFKTSDGQPWTQIGCTDFRLLERFIAGEDIGPVLSERQTLGFNQLRVFAMCGNMFRLFPQEHPDYAAQLADFLHLVSVFGLRVELTVLVDATVVMPQTAQQQQFFADVCRIVQGMPHVQIELVNEVDQEINVIDTNAFTQPHGLISSHGSFGVVDAAVQPVCVQPIWSYGTLHPSRPADWPRLGGHNTMEDVGNKYGRPGTDNESCRPDQGRGPIATDWFDAAGNISLLCAGGTFHSQAGKDSRTWDPVERDCAVAWVAGAKAVPLSYQRGSYIAGHLSGFPINWVEGDSSRAHGRLIGDKACLSLPQMKDGYVPTARPGWRITKQTGSVIEVMSTPGTGVLLAREAEANPETK
jgi:hypothetical protein